MSMSFEDKNILEWSRMSWEARARGDNGTAALYSEIMEDAKRKRDQRSRRTDRTITVVMWLFVAGAAAHAAAALFGLLGLALR